MTRVLVVDDSPTQAAEVRFMLEAAGFEVEVAPDGRQGLDRFHNGAFDVVVSDILMPVMNGYELCRAIKSEPAGRSVPVILLTMLNDPMDVISALECGADNFITKPAQPDRLVSRINGLLGSRALRAGKPSDAGVDLAFGGQKFNITSGREQILDLLISVFEDTVRTNAQLQARESELLAANESLEAFTSAVAHDLRAPLWTILGFAHLVADSESRLSQDGLGYLKRIEKGVRQMADLVDGLLNLSRVDKQELAATPTDLNQMVAEVIGDLGAANPGRVIDWRVQPLPTVVCDPALVKQVFVNLLANAVKFTRPRECAVIEVGSIVRESPQQSAIYVRDNGVGFDMSQAHKIFNAFQRLHRRDQFEGSGVGLATVQRIVRRHGGHLWAEAEVDRGAAFFFTLDTVTEGV
jgi:two-component system sensor histidine kinase/response regulator